MALAIPTTEIGIERLTRVIQEIKGQMEEPGFFHTMRKENVNIFGVGYTRCFMIMRQCISRSFAALDDDDQWAIIFRELLIPYRSFVVEAKGEEARWRLITGSVANSMERRFYRTRIPTDGSAYNPAIVLDAQEVLDNNLSETVTMENFADVPIEAIYDYLGWVGGEEFEGLTSTMELTGEITVPRGRIGILQMSPTNYVSSVRYEIEPSTPSWVTLPGGTLDGTLHVSPAITDIPKVYLAYVKVTDEIGKTTVGTITITVTA